MYVRELVLPADKPTKFWTIALDGNSTTATFGKIGSAGKTTKKLHADEHAAITYFYKESNTKLVKQRYVCRHVEPSAENGFIRLLLQGKPSQSHFVDIHPTTNHLAIGNKSSIEIVDLDGVVIDTIKNTKSSPRAVRFSPDGKYLAWQDNENGPRPFLYDLATKKRRQLATPPDTGGSDGLAFDASGKRLLVNIPTKTLVFDLAKPKPIFEIAHAKPAVGRSMDTAAAISSDGKRVAICGAEEHAISIYEIGKKKPKTISLGKGRGAMALAFSPDGKLVVAASVYCGDHVTLIFETATGKQRLPKVFSRSNGSTHFGVDISPDGKWIATGGYFSEIEVHDLARGKQILRAADHYRRVYDLRFSRDGRYLLTSDYNAGFVVVHELTAELLKKTFEGPRF